MRPDPASAGGEAGSRIWREEQVGLIDGCKVASNDCGIVISILKGIGMWGFHSLKRGILLERQEEVRKHRQVQQVQWMKPH